MLAKQIQNNYAHAQYYDCLRHCFFDMHQLIWGQYYWVLSQSPWAPRNNYLAAKRILFMIIFLLPQFSKQEFEQLVLHNSKLGGKMSSWILLLACTCRAGGLRFAYYFTNSGAHNQLLVNKIITENKIVPSDFNNLKIKKERRKEKSFRKIDWVHVKFALTFLFSLENVIGKYPAVVFAVRVILWHAIGISLHRPLSFMFTGRIRMQIWCAKTNMT